MPVACATMAKSTIEVAQAVGEVIAASGLQLDVLPVREIQNLADYDAVVVEVR